MIHNPLSSYMDCCTNVAGTNQIVNRNYKYLSTLSAGAIEDAEKALNALDKLEVTSATANWTYRGRPYIERIIGAHVPRRRAFHPTLLSRPATQASARP